MTAEAMCGTSLAFWEWISRKLSADQYLARMKRKVTDELSDDRKYRWYASEKVNQSLNFLYARLYHNDGVRICRLYR